MRNATLAVLIALVLAPASLALAQDGGAPDATYDFDDDLVTGGRYDPIGDDIRVWQRSGHRSLIRARAHFIPEMIKSVEHL